MCYWSEPFMTLDLHAMVFLYPFNIACTHSRTSRQSHGTDHGRAACSVHH